MIVGSKAELALEYEVVPYVGDYALGHFCMWADGRMIGDFADVVVLGAVAAQLDRSLLFTGQRTDNELSSASKLEAIEILHEALYGEGGDIELSTAQSLRYGPFDLKGLGISAFDGLFVFLIDSTEGQRLLWSDTDRSEVFEARLPALEYDRIAHECLQQLKDLMRMR